MSDVPGRQWQEVNQRYVGAALAEVHAALARYVERITGDESRTIAATVHEASGDPTESLQSIAAAMTVEPPLEALCTLFALSRFERAVLLLCAGIELDASFGPLCAAAHDDSSSTCPTFSLALASLPDPHWSALTPAGPLRRWRLIELGEALALTSRPLRISERVLHHLLGLPGVDEQLLEIAEPVDEVVDLAPSQRTVAERVCRLWTSTDDSGPLPVLHLRGDDTASIQDVAYQACARCGMKLLLLRARFLPTNPTDLRSLIFLCEREAALSGVAFLLDCDDLDPADAPGAPIARFVESFDGFLILMGLQRDLPARRPLLTLDVRKPTSGEQSQLWRDLLAEYDGETAGQVDALSSQFDLSTRVIRAASSVPRYPVVSDGNGRPANNLGALVWDECRMRTRPRLEGLAQRIEPAAIWEDLIIPEQQRQTLREIAIHVRHRRQVYDSWGFAALSARGLGITALFTGSSGTGKTMAAEILANELRLDLYRIDLSATVSKYIGETEKNLRRIFDAADAGGAILLFDEADALFGKRSEVRDSHDRYANIEVSYLLQRMEAYRGLAILTTNMKDALDRAFLRRIRFVVEFPLPSPADRARIWERVFPGETPTEGLNVDRLARLSVAGGNIRNIAMNAAFLAAESSEPVRMSHVLRAARTEYAKLEKPLTDAETGDWI